MDTYEEVANRAEVVTTWADDLGWFARVAFPDMGYGHLYLDYHMKRIRAKARRAIRREILARENGPIRPVRIEVDDLEYNPSTDKFRSITWVES